MRDRNSPYMAILGKKKKIWTESSEWPTIFLSGRGVSSRLLDNFWVQNLKNNIWIEFRGPTTPSALTAAS